MDWSVKFLNYRPCSAIQQQAFHLETHQLFWCLSRSSRSWRCNANVQVVSCAVTPLPPLTLKVIKGFSQDLWFGGLLAAESLVYLPTGSTCSTLNRQSSTSQARCRLSLVVLIFLGCFRTENISASKKQFAAFISECSS